MLYFAILSFQYAFVPKIFCVFIPSDQLTNVRSVKIKTLQSPSVISRRIDNKDLEEHPKIKRLWTLRVSLPANITPNFRYKYSATGTTRMLSSLRSSYGYGEVDDIVSESRQRTCSDMRTERDIFGDSNNIADGLSGHFMHILHDADDTDINESFHEMNNLKEVENLSTDRKEKIIQELIKSGYLTTPLKSLCFFGMLAVMKSGFRPDLHLSKNLLIGISNSKMVHMDKSLKKSILSVVLEICSSMQQSSFVHFITYAYPFFDEEIMLDIFNNSEKYNLKKSSASLWEAHQKTSWEGRVIDCVNIICNRAIHERIRESIELLQKFLSCLPAQQTLKCVNQILVEFHDHSEFSQDVQHLLTTVADKYDRQLSEYAQNGHANGIEEMWKNMDVQSRLSFLTKIEESLLLCFEDKFLINSSRATCTVLISMCKGNNELFREEKQQNKLFNYLNRSQYDRCHELFQQLIELPGFCKKDSQSCTAFVVGWFETVLKKTKESGGSDGTRIKMIYAKLGSVMEKSEIIRANQELQKCLSKMTYSFMQNDIDIDEALSMVGCIWFNDTAEEWFFTHLRQLIYSQCGAAKKLGEKLFKEKGDVFEVNKR